MKRLIVNNDAFFADVETFLAEGKKVTIPVRGCSMLPLIRGGRDLVELEAPEDLKVGDIVLFHGGKYIMHRILSIDGDRLVIKGDGVVKGEEHVLKSDVRGKATAILRSGKRRIDPYSPRQMRRLKVWNALFPVRRVLTAVYRRLPWNRPL